MTEQLIGDMAYSRSMYGTALEHFDHAITNLMADPSYAQTAMGQKEQARLKWSKGSVYCSMGQYKTALYLFKQTKKKPGNR